MTFLIKEPVGDVCVDFGEEQVRLVRDVHVASLYGPHWTWTRAYRSCMGGGENVSIHAAPPHIKSDQVHCAHHK